jgi:hypothetical protein
MKPPPGLDWPGGVGRDADYAAMMTSDDLMIVLTFEPVFNPRSSTASLVIEAVTVKPLHIDSNMRGGGALLDVLDSAVEGIARR